VTAGVALLPAGVETWSVSELDMRMSGATIRGAAIVSNPGLRPFTASFM
jgi:hypothetical protein